METEFNLLDEKWIRLRGKNCTVDELPLIDTLLHAHEYKGLAGELPTQDVAILRLLLAILHTVFYYYAPDGEEEILEDPDDVLDRWEELWNAGRFPEEPIRKYFDKWHDRFWLFHPERPFYQSVETADEKTAAEFKAAKINSSISESNNKTRIFASRAGKEKAQLNYAEAARWLVHMQAFDDGSNERGKGVKAIGVSWLGNLGIIVAHGNNLFEDLMLNMIVLDGNRDVWEEEKPVWEQKPCSEPRREVPHPRSLSELYTLQSRRIFLYRENGYVTKCNICGGDYYEKNTYALIEPMTLWKMEGKKDSVEGEKRIPKTHNISRQMWREFATCFPHENDKTCPGIVSWICYLNGKKIIENNKYISFDICSVEYDKMKSCYEDIFSDGITFHTDLLAEVSTSTRIYNKIMKEIAIIDQIADALGDLYGDIVIASGFQKNTDNGAKKLTEIKNRVKEKFYHEVDVPFRVWLKEVDPTMEAMSVAETECFQKWHKKVLEITMRAKNEIVESAGPVAMVGRDVKVNEKKTKYYSLPKACNFFTGQLRKICKDFE